MYAEPGAPQSMSATSISVPRDRAAVATFILPETLWATRFLLKFRTLLTRLPGYETHSSLLQQENTSHGNS
ncbi:MAG: hypothetical protein ACKVT0_09340 [Planctomycetaceae bacterium]